MKRWIWMFIFSVFCSLSYAEPGVPQDQNKSNEMGSTGQEWTYERFQSAVKESGRNFSINEAKFLSLQERKKSVIKSLENYLATKFGKADERVIQAFSQVPREYFHYYYPEKRDFSSAAYEDKAKAWAVGYGSALSDYEGQAYMTQLAQPKPGDVFLEIGTGSGYQVSLMSRIVKEAYSIEIIKPLGESVGKIFQPLGYSNVHTRVGDGFFGWPDVQGGFDIIMFTCAAQYVPPAIIQQLKPGGRLIVPIGQPFKHGQVLYIYSKDKEGKVRSRKDVGVFFIPMTGEAMKPRQGK